jgi:hypothetical protein
MTYSQEDIRLIMEYGGCVPLVKSATMDSAMPKAWRSPDNVVTNYDVLLQDWNFLKSLESKMIEEAGIKFIDLKFIDKVWTKRYAESANGRMYDLVRNIYGSGTTELEAVLNSIIGYLNKKELK